MKPTWLPVLLLCSGCAAITTDPWGWLDDPARQQWVDVRIVSHGREIRYAVPDRREPGGQSPRFWPPSRDGATAPVAQAPSGLGGERTRPLGQYLWDRWWGGFLKGSGHDFSLNVRVERVDDEPGLLGLTIGQRLQRPVDFRTSVYSRPDPDSRRLGEYFFERFRVWPFRSEQGHVWVARNNPIVTADHVYYTIPIGDRHILEFSFFVRDKRYDWKNDPEWNAQRWALVEQIMNTVRITPDPFPEEGEAAVSESRFN